VDDDYYTQLNMVKTIEQILGIRPMNQEDLAAGPMYDAFTEHPNFAPYDVQPNQIPLNLGAPGGPTTLTAVAASATPAERKAFSPQGIVPANMRPVYEAWQAWGKQLSPSSRGRARSEASSSRSRPCASAPPPGSAVTRPS
jgi:hypothetical protein